MTDYPYMEGNAVHARGAGRFSVPAISHIKDKLWMGCSPAEFPFHNLLTDYDSLTLRDEPRFDAILNLYQWGEYQVPHRVESVVVEMYDAYGKVDGELLESLADQVISWLKQGKRVFVHCQAGLNRSSLVVARVLMKHYNMTSYEAIDHIRFERSPMCLCNQDFENYLRSLDKTFEFKGA